MVAEIEKVEKSLVKAVDEKTIRDFLFTSGTKLNEKQQNMFLQIAIRHNLDPFKREIYPIAYGNEFSIVTGYEVYIQRAEKTGNLSGWHCENTEEGAKITILSLRSSISNGRLSPVYSSVSSRFIVIKVSQIQVLVSIFCEIYFC